ncbi:MOSC domain-containing protein [Methylorubrum extorquens]|uniref:MOSC domain-containing protein n=1 Tax=Methylorubrum extorquens TaxID=408 RepID=A0AAX3WLF3_METEX|nr:MULTISPECIES: MOSC N-terminal beta barrel domain-containing protein [Methylobacteriaceae]KQO94843.1 molybdenum cofactor sulfurase [Methylobacterium sp. Leaf92]KQQ01685.1 molybdenum cofactor sulfurase [Methylobacterium sp. Leaf122]WHQ72429.1 MOSC domain-containing protein [Methylorubrum extorquens]
MSQSPALRIAALYRYPVKGLSPEALETAELETSGYFPGDRLYAIENGPSGFNETVPRHLPKIAYLMLMRNEALARLRTRFDDATHRLTVEENGVQAVDADLSTAEGREALAEFMKGFLPQELRGAPRVLTAPPGYRFTDSRTGYVSLINRASVAATEDLAGAPVDPLRFRGNLYLDGLEPWAELDMVGRVLEAGDVRLKITSRTERCAATNVDPQTGQRDLSIPRTLMQGVGHTDCGVYAEVLAGGVLRTGDSLRVIG